LIRQEIRADARTRAGRGAWRALRRNMPFLTSRPILD